MLECSLASAKPVHQRHGPEDCCREYRNWSVPDEDQLHCDESMAHFSRFVNTRFPRTILISS